MDVYFHSGEQYVQSLLGTRNAAEAGKSYLHTTISETNKIFIESQSLLVIGSSDNKGQLWASLIWGKPGYMRVLDHETLHIQVRPNAVDPLFDNIAGNANVGIVIIDFSNRTRIRINGLVVDKVDGMIEVKTEQVYRNCPKYIQARQIEFIDHLIPSSPEGIRTTFLNEQQQKWISEADTFFVASANAGGKTDASHRGGQPGFVHILDNKTLIYPDYQGNPLFNTLGNVYENSKTGLLFMDFHHGRTMQLTGESIIVWNPSLEEKLRFPGALRLVQYRITEVIQTDKAHSLSWSFINYSPFNPN